MTCWSPGHCSMGQEGLAGIFGVPERYIDSITFKTLGRSLSEGRHLSFTQMHNSNLSLYSIIYIYIYYHIYIYNHIYIFL